VQSPSAAQLTVGAWQRSSFDVSQVQLSGTGGGVPPSLSLPPALPLQAHCSPADSHEKPAPQSLAVVHGST